MSRIINQGNGSHAAKVLRVLVGQTIHHFRIAATKSMVECAGELEISVSTYHRIEGGQVNISIYTITKLLNLFKVTPDVFFLKPWRTFAALEAENLTKQIPLSEVRLGMEEGPDREELFKQIRMKFNEVKPAEPVQIPLL